MSDYLIPSESDRRRLFYFIKKATSYRAWARAEPYYKAWVGVFEAIYKHSIQHPHLTEGQLLADDKMVSVLKGLASFEEALARLRRGDRRCFKWRVANGYFIDANRPIEFWYHVQYRYDMDLAYQELVESEYWPPMWKALNDNYDSLCETEPAIESEAIDAPAKLAYLAEEGGADFLKAHCVFPAEPLPEVPNPMRTTLLKTGDVIPFYGVYEPVKVEIKTGFLGLGKIPVPPTDGIYEVIGCMNYLHKDSLAPTMETDVNPVNPQSDRTSVVWRLLWKDTRYEDGVIPEEEKDYAFFPIGFRRESASFAESRPDDDLIVLSSGVAASRGGRWVLEGKLDVAINIREGEKLPEHNSEKVRWIFSGT